MITSSSIDTVRDADIVPVVQRFVELKKSGANWKGLSPFVQEKTPSFVVSPVKNIFKCFASGIGGDAIKFVMLHENVDFIHAIKIIAEINGITLEEEEATEEQKAQVNRRLNLGNVIERATDIYAKTLRELPADHWARVMLAERGYDEETILEFQIGYAPADHNFLSKPIIEKGKVSEAKAVGIIKTKDQRTYDFFFDRIIFPIRNEKGDVISFGGRRSNEESAAKWPKYLNLGDTELYNKSMVLYGLHLAKKPMARKGFAILVEGYTDVVTLHQRGADTAVAACGTALTGSQVNRLLKYTPTVIIFTDGDDAGKRAAMKDVDILLGNDLKVQICICPEGEDPDTWARKTENIEQWILDKAKDACVWKAEQLAIKASNDPDELAKAVKEVAEMLVSINNTIKQNEYIKLCARALKVKIGDLKSEIQRIIDTAEKAYAAQPTSADDALADKLNLPKGADWQEFKEHRFVTSGNSFWFQGGNGFFRGTNFTISALFHIYGKNENKRLCELRNTEGHQRLLDFDSKDFVNFSSFQEKCIDEGFFVFLPEISTVHFKLVTQRVLNDFIMAYELKTLGWQTERFFAFADGVFANGQFKEVNKYGIIQVDVEEKVESEYQQDVKHFYSPAFSEIYKHSREDDDPYENDRSFVYKKSPVPIETWMAQMVKVYGEKGITAIAFAFATCFRDFIMSRYHFFPHLFLTGEKGSGKSKYGDSIANFFTYKLEPFDLNAGTLVGFYRRLSRLRNVPAFCEEYHDKIDDRMFQGIKGGYDGRGREKGQATADNRTTISKVNTSLIIAGQYLSVRDDNSVTSRSLVNHFVKPQDPFTNEQIEEYDKLKMWEEQGLSSLVLEVIKYRPQIEANFHKTFADTSRLLKKDLAQREYQERMLMNYNALLSVMKVLWGHFEFPFTYSEMYEQFKNAIIDNSDLITESEGLAEFWRMLPILVREGRMRLGHEYEIAKTASFTFNPKTGVSEKYENTNRDKILYLRLTPVHHYYHQYASRLEGMDVIGESTMRNYFKSKRYFIGPISNRRFNDADGNNTNNGSCYAFNYTMMEKSGVLNLDTITDAVPAGMDDSEENKDDLPF